MSRPQFFLFLFLFTALTRFAAAADGGSLGGRIADPLGAPIAAAKITLLRDRVHVSEATTDAQGEFTFAALAEGRYTVEANASGFAPQTSDAVFLGANSSSLLPRPKCRRRR